MKLDRARARSYLRSFDFPGLFTQCLGWDQVSAPISVQVDGQDYQLDMVADKRGVKALVCEIPEGCAFPDYAARCRIDGRVTRYAREHVIIYADSAKTLQVWQWVRRSAGMPVVRREQHLHTGQTGEALLQRLEAVVFTLEEEEWLTTLDVLGRFAASGAYAGKVTKRFYDQFKDEHARFLKFLKGIPDEHCQRWYASVMLDRLMFIYFIQKKGFLGDGDTGYLKARLAESKQREKDTFYREFLCPLFFDGLARKDDDPKKQSRAALLRRVPYLNGGIFLEHKIERECGDIRIADAAFDAVFRFFEEWDWTLDDRKAIESDHEINPAVLGYIFEKYINAIQPGEQKAKGAYYTQDDITEYIGRNTIAPRLLDIARGKCRSKAEFDRIWALLAGDPISYIFEPVRRGVFDEGGNVIPQSRLPDFVQDGMLDPKTRMDDKRYNLGDAKFLSDAREDFPPDCPPQVIAAGRLTLPTETWREYVARRQRCLELRDKLAKNGVREANDLISYNLDIRQFLQDVIERCEDPELLGAFWQALSDITILDPTCGSGAFLFAALNILYPLYLACLTRMQAFVSDLECCQEKRSPKKYEHFKQVLAQVHKHPNESYFILKSIVVRNLFGVDIMDEAVEICKLRLFLKLIAQVERVEDMEPLPDIDFNIRCGNSLVGYAAEARVRAAFVPQEAKRQARIAYGEDQDALASIRLRLEDWQQEVDVFRQRQLDVDKFQKVPQGDKEKVAAKRDALNAELNVHLARQYGVKRLPPSASSPIAPDSEFGSWLLSRKPFHWFVEFFGIMKSGGFAVIIGNPPYVEIVDVTAYRMEDYATKDCGDLYALLLERASDLVARGGRVGMIVPMSCFSVDGFKPVQALYYERCAQLHVSHWSGDAHPARLFEGVDKRLEIILALVGRTGPTCRVYTSKYSKWYTEERQALFQLRPAYAGLEARKRISFFDGALPKFHTTLETSIQDRLKSTRLAVGQLAVSSGRHHIYYTRKVSFFFQFLDFVPEVRDGRGRRRDPSELKTMFFPSADVRDLCLGCLSSSTFYWYNIANSDCRNLNKREVSAFPVPTVSSKQLAVSLSQILRRLMKDYQCNSTRRTVDYKGVGNVTVQYFDFRPSKPIIDEIDKMLAPYYGFRDEELDFIINYDIKYRMGRSAGEEE